MKKVGLVTCYFKHNYGSMLQAYATQKVLNDNQILNETINIEKNVDFSKGKKKYYLTQLFNYGFIKSKFGMIKLKFDKIVNKELRKNIAIRDKKYEEFKKEFNLSKSCIDYEGLKKLANEKYSDLIVGSDQLWLPVNVVADYYTLNWVPEKINKISYSTSFGVSSIPKKYYEQYNKFLKRINHLSVREESGVKLIKDIANINAKLVCDPTILLTKDEWKEVSIKERIIKDKYILCYFLGNNIEHRKFAERLKRETGFKIVSLNHADEYVKYSDTFADIKPYDIGPREFINLVKNAEFVCTDSFHCTVFSLIFNKLFFCFRRHKSTIKGSTNSRIDSLLNVVGVSHERILTGNEDVEKVLKYSIDFKKVNKNLETFRSDSKKWLLNSITWKQEYEEKYIEIEDKDLCSGCTACKNICPQDAIEMVRDEEGFLYPKVKKEKCIECGLCKKKCPILNKSNFNIFEQRAFLFQNKKEEVRKDSTSGGFFTAIGEYVINNGGIVYGASFDKNFKVNHTKAVKVEELKKFRKSKYVQSNLNNIFREIKEDLLNGRLVCFSGTPCQVAGLNSFLGKKYENLILIDIMCHSVPSPLYFEKYKEYVLKKMNASKILDINFRDKSKYGYKYSMMTIKTNNGVYSQGIDTDPYLRAFFEDYSVRPSCYNCSFKTQKRVSDITIWDCFNINEIAKDFDDDKGTTRLLVQSEKGNNVVNSLENVRLKEIDVTTAINKVREMTKSVNYNSKREEFYNSFDKECFIDDFFPVNMKTILNSFIRKILSLTGLYSIVKSVTKKILKK